MSEYIIKIGFWLHAYDGFTVEADSDSDAIEKAKAAAGTAMESAAHPEHIEIGERREGIIAFIDRITVDGRHAEIEDVEFDDDHSRRPTRLIPLATGPRGPARVRSFLELLGGQSMSHAAGTIGASGRNLPPRYLALLETIVLCLSVPIRGYDDPNFDIPSATLSLHLQSCEIVSASLWGLGQARHAAEKHSSRTADKSQA